MTEDNMDQIEAALSLKLPVCYRQFMLNYPKWLPKQQPDWSDVARWELADDPERVIHFNRHVRSRAPGEYFDDGPWPASYFVIGSEGEQNWYFLDLASGSEVVHLFHHEMGEVHEVAASLAEFPDYLLTWWSEVEQWG